MDIPLPGEAIPSPPQSDMEECSEEPTPVKEPPSCEEDLENEVSPQENDSSDNDDVEPDQEDSLPEEPEQKPDLPEPPLPEGPPPIIPHMAAPVPPPTFDHIPLPPGHQDFSKPPPRPNFSLPPPAPNFMARPPNMPPPPNFGGPPHGPPVSFGPRPPHFPPHPMPGGPGPGPNFPPHQGPPFGGHSNFQPNFPPHMGGPPPTNLPPPGMPGPHGPMGHHMPPGHPRGMPGPVRPPSNMPPPNFCPRPDFNPCAGGPDFPNRPMAPDFMAQSKPDFLSKSIVSEELSQAILESTEKDDDEADDSKYSPSRVTPEDDLEKSDNAALESMELTGDAATAAIEPEPQKPPPPKMTVLGKMQAKKRLLAFSMTKQGGGTGLSFGFAKTNAKMNKTSAFGEEEEEKKEQKKKRKKEEKEVLAIEEIKREEERMKFALSTRPPLSYLMEIKPEAAEEVPKLTNFTVLDSSGEKVDVIVKVEGGEIGDKPRSPVNESEDKSVTVKSEKSESKSKESKSKDDKKEKSKDKDRDRDRDKGKDSERSQKDEKRRQQRRNEKKRYSEMPVSWGDFKVTDYRFEDIRRLKRLADEKRSPNRSRSSRRRRSRSRDKRSRSRERRGRGRHKRSRSRSKSPGFKETKLRYPFIALGIKQTEKEYPAYMVKYTKSRPILAFCENPAMFPGYYKTRKELFASEPPEIVELMKNIIDGASMDSEVNSNGKHVSGLAALQQSYEGEEELSDMEVDEQHRERSWWLEKVENFLVETVSGSEVPKESPDGNEDNNVTEMEQVIKASNELELSASIESHSEDELQEEEDVESKEMEHPLLRSKWDSDYDSEVHESTTDKDKSPISVMKGKQGYKRHNKSTRHNKGEVEKYSEKNDGNVHSQETEDRRDEGNEVTEKLKNRDQEMRRISKDYEEDESERVVDAIEYDEREEYGRVTEITKHQNSDDKNFATETDSKKDTLDQEVRSDSKLASEYEEFIKAVQNNSSSTAVEDFIDEDNFNEEDMKVDTEDSERDTNLKENVDVGAKRISERENSISKKDVESDQSKMKLKERSRSESVEKSNKKGGEESIEEPNEKNDDLFSSLKENVTLDSIIQEITLSSKRKKNRMRSRSSSEENVKKTKRKKLKVAKNSKETEKAKEKGRKKSKAASTDESDSDTGSPKKPKKSKKKRKQKKKEVHSSGDEDGEHDKKSQKKRDKKKKKKKRKKAKKKVASDDSDSGDESGQVEGSEENTSMESRKRKKKSVKSRGSTSSVDRSSVSPIEERKKKKKKRKKKKKKHDSDEDQGSSDENEETTKSNKSKGKKHSELVDSDTLLKLLHSSKTSEFPTHLLEMLNKDKSTFLKIEGSKGSKKKEKSGHKEESDEDAAKKESKSPEKYKPKTSKSNEKTSSSVTDEDEVKKRRKSRSLSPSVKEAPKRRRRRSPSTSEHTPSPPRRRLSHQSDDTRDQKENKCDGENHEKKLKQKCVDQKYQGKVHKENTEEEAEEELERESESDEYSKEKLCEGDEDEVSSSDSGSEDDDIPHEEVIEKEKSELDDKTEPWNSDEAKISTSAENVNECDLSMEQVDVSEDSKVTVYSEKEENSLNFKLDDVSSDAMVDYQVSTEADSTREVKKDSVNLDETQSLSNISAISLPEGNSEDGDGSEQQVSKDNAKSSIFGSLEFKPITVKLTHSRLQTTSHPEFREENSYQGEDKPRLTLKLDKVADGNITTGKESGQKKDNKNESFEPNSSERETDSSLPTTHWSRHVGDRNWDGDKSQYPNDIFSNNLNQSQKNERRQVSDDEIFDKRGNMYRNLSPPLQIRRLESVADNEERPTSEIKERPSREHRGQSPIFSEESLCDRGYEDKANSDKSLDRSFQSYHDTSENLEPVHSSKRSPITSSYDKDSDIHPSEQNNECEKESPSPHFRGSRSPETQSRGAQSPKRHYHNDRSPNSVYRSNRSPEQVRRSAPSPDRQPRRRYSRESHNFRSPDRHHRSTSDSRHRRNQSPGPRKMDARSPVQERWSRSSGKDIGGSRNSPSRSQDVLRGRGASPKGRSYDGGDRSPRRRSRSRSRSHSARRSRSRSMSPRHRNFRNRDGNAGREKTWRERDKEREMEKRRRSNRDERWERDDRRRRNRSPTPPHRRRSASYSPDFHRSGSPGYRRRSERNKDHGWRSPGSSRSPSRKGHDDRYNRVENIPLPLDNIPLPETPTQHPFTDDFNSKGSNEKEKEAVSEVERNSPASSPLVGLKRVVADSTISDSELLGAGVKQEEPDMIQNSNKNFIHSVIVQQASNLKTVPIIDGPVSSDSSNQKENFLKTVPVVEPAGKERKERTKGPFSPKRISLDDRIELELGVKKEVVSPEKPQPIPVYQQHVAYAAGHYPFYPQYPDDGSGDTGAYPKERTVKTLVSAAEVDNQYSYTSADKMSKTMQQNLPYLKVKQESSVATDWDNPEAFIGTQAATSAPAGISSRVVQVGNVLQVVPAELPPISVPPIPPKASIVVQAGNMLQVVPAETLPTRTTQVVQVGNVLRVVPTASLSKVVAIPTPVKPPLPSETSAKSTSVSASSKVTSTTVTSTGIPSITTLPSGKVITTPIKLNLTSASLASLSNVTSSAPTVNVTPTPTTITITTLPPPVVTQAEAQIKPTVMANASLSFAKPESIVPTSMKSFTETMFLPSTEKTASELTLTAGLENLSPMQAKAAAAVVTGATALGLTITDYLKHYTNVLMKGASAAAAAKEATPKDAPAATVVNPQSSAVKEEETAKETWAFNEDETQKTSTSAENVSVPKRHKKSHRDGSTKVPVIIQRKESVSSDDLSETKDLTEMIENSIKAKMERKKSVAAAIAAVEDEIRRSRRRREKRKRERQERHRLNRAARKELFGEQEDDASIVVQQLQDPDMDPEELRLIQEAISEVPGDDDFEQSEETNMFRSRRKKKKKKVVDVIPLPPAGRGILISPGFREKPILLVEDNLDTKRKAVSFADGIRPGEGTSPSGGEEMSSPPPPPRKLPKEKRYKVKTKKKKKVKLVFEDDEDEEDESPPPPPPGSPPPTVRFANTNNVSGQLYSKSNYVYPSSSYAAVASAPSTSVVQAQMTNIAGIPPQAPATPVLQQSQAPGSPAVMQASPVPQLLQSPQVIQASAPLLMQSGNQVLQTTVPAVSPQQTNTVFSQEYPQFTTSSSGVLYQHNAYQTMATNIPPPVHFPPPAPGSGVLQQNQTVVPSVANIPLPVRTPPLPADDPAGTSPIMPPPRKGPLLPTPPIPPLPLPLQGPGSEMPLRRTSRFSKSGRHKSRH